MTRIIPEWNFVLLSLAKRKVSRSLHVKLLAAHYYQQPLPPSGTGEDPSRKYAAQTESNLSVFKFLVRGFGPIFVLIASFYPNSTGLNRNYEHLSI